MKRESQELIDNLISGNLELDKEQLLLKEYLKNREFNNQLVFQKIESEFEKLNFNKLGKLLYLPYSVNPKLSIEEEKIYVELLSSSFIHHTNKLSISKPDSESIWILYVISDILFHLPQAEKYLDDRFIQNTSKIFLLNTDEDVYEISILIKNIYTVLHYINTKEAHDKISLLSQHPNFSELLKWIK